MRTLTLFMLSVLMCAAASASPSSVWWPAWTISSGEELSGGIEYSKNGYTPSFPLSFLFDDDPQTAWVYSAKSREFFEPFHNRYGIQLKPAKPISIDGLRLMNGQNANRARFLSNKRVTKIRVTMEVGKAIIVCTFALPDTMGFHNVSLPRRQITSLMIEFIGLKNGMGDNDLCVSELQLTSRGQKVDMQMPRAVMFYDGAEGDAGETYLLRGDTMLDGIGMDYGYTDEWSKDGRYVAGLSGDGGHQYLWIADARQGKIVRRLYNRNDLEYKWQKDNRLRVRQYVKQKFVPLKVVSPPFFK